MKTRSFKKYLEKRLNKDEIAEIEAQAELEVNILQFFQEAIANAMESYMQKNKVGFNELVRRLNSSPAHVAKIQRGQANLTLSSLAHIFALLGKSPQDVFKYKK